MREPGTITRAVNGVASGQLPTDADPAISHIYHELRRLAASRLASGHEGTIQATELVHDSFLKLFRPGQPPWESRAHFFGSAARAMQQVLIDRWRAREPASGGAELLGSIPAPAVHPIALSAEVERLASLDPLIAEIVRLRVFAGLSVEQTAEVLGVSERTVKRHFAFARAWLFRQLMSPPGGGVRFG